MIGMQTQSKKIAQKRKICKMSLKHFSALITLIIVIAVLSTIAAAASSRLRASQHKVCITDACHEASKMVLKNIDQSVNPCDDFYNFACGNFIKTTHIPEDKSMVISFSLISDKVSKQIKQLLEEPQDPKAIKPFNLVKRYYKMCLAEDKSSSVEYLLDILAQLGNWPVVEGEEWNEDTFEWKNMMYQLRSLGLSYDFFINFYVGADTNNTFRRILDFDQADPGLEREYLIQGIDNEIVTAYYNLIVDLAELCGADRNFALKDIKEVVEFEIEIAKITLSREDRRNATALYNPMQVKDLNERFPYVSWVDYLNKLIAIENITIGLDQDVDVGVPKYYSELDLLLNRTPKRVQANYIMSLLVMELVPYLSEDFKNAEAKFDKITSGTKTRRPVWNECARLAIGKFRQASGALYVRKYFDDDSRKGAVKLVASLKRTFIEMLKTIDWMDETTKKRAFEKAEAMDAHVAYPQEFLDDNKIKEYYSELQTASNENFLEFTLKIKKFKQDKSYLRLPLPINKTDWIDHSSATDVNAYYDTEENSIQLPAGILQGVFFENKRPQYMNFGAMGFAIGHEITHGFDDVGRQFDKNGILSEWWEEHTKTAFIEKAQCIIYEYGNYTVPDLNLQLDGVNTQGENIADNGGVKEAYLAYNSWVKIHGTEPLLPNLNYTQAQLFWISTAHLWCSAEREEYLKQQVLTDAHSPSRFRIIGSLSNSEHFAKDFNCPLGSNMNPKHKCQVW